MYKLYSLYYSKIAVFRALQIGDLLCAIPAIRAIKSSFPESNITLIGLPWAANFVKRFSNYFSSFMLFPGYPGLPEQPFDYQKFSTFLKEANYHQFDLLMQMQGNGSIVNPLMAMLGASEVAGFKEPLGYAPDNNLFLEYPDHLHEIERHLALVQHLGVPSKGTFLEFPVMDEEKLEFEILNAELGLRLKQYVIIHPGARDNKRWWSPEKFAKAADYMHEKGYTILLTGTEIESLTVNQVASLMKAPSINLCGKTNLGVLAELIRHAKLLLSNDTGVSHIAAAMRTPSVVIFLTSDPARWAPLDKNLHRVILPAESENLGFVIESMEKAICEPEWALQNSFYSN